MSRVFAAGLAAPVSISMASSPPASRFMYRVLKGVVRRYLPAPVRFTQALGYC